MAILLGGCLRARSLIVMASWLLVLGGCGIHAESVARTRAANDFNCSEDQIEITEVGGTSYRATGCDHSQVYDCAETLSAVGGYGGRATFVCVAEGQGRSSSAGNTGAGTEPADPQGPTAPSSAADSPASAQAAKPRGVAPPTGVAGFTFGSTVEATQAACEAKYAWAASGADLFECSGTPKTIGTNAHSLLKFCAGALCKAVFVVRPDSDQSSEWLHQFVVLKTGLVGKYGEPVEDRVVPNQCGNDILPCVRSGTAHVKYTWTFPSGTFIVLVLSNTPGPDAVIRLTYARGEPAEAPAL